MVQWSWDSDCERWLPRRRQLLNPARHPAPWTAAITVTILLAGLFGATPAAASLFLVCPCEVESDGTTFKITAGVNSYRDVNSGPLHLGVVVFQGPERPALALGDVRITDSLASGSLLARATYELPVDADRFSSGEYVIGIRLYESHNESLRWADTLRMEFAVNPAGTFEVGELDYLKDSDGDGVGDANERLEGTDPDDSESVPDVATIDILSFYTDGFADLFDGDPTTRIQHLFTVSNQILAESEVSFRFRLVGAVKGPVDLAQRNSRYFRFVHNQEASRHGADLVVWFPRSGAGSCGYSPIGASGDRGHFEFERERDWFASVYGNCGARVLVHELGHLMGLGHSNWQESVGTWRWSRGHAIDDDFGTIMTYGPQNGNGRRLDVFSSPLTTCVGLQRRSKPCGVDRAQIDGADALASLDAVQYRIAAFRESLPDADADGFVDPVDEFPDDGAEWRDFDGDGVGNNGDDDDDNDGVVDGDDLFPFNVSEWVDTDDDGVGDNADAFPEDPGETADTDGDGVGDNADAFPGDRTETVDTDEDGVGDNADLWPDNPAESGDADGDGVGDNADRDADNDGVIDEFDPYPLDAGKTSLVSYLLWGEQPGDLAGRVLASGRVGDRRVIAVGVPQHDLEGKPRAGAVYLIAAHDLESLDSADGARDRIIDLGHVTAGANSWKVVGESRFDQAGYAIDLSSDLNGDGVADLLVGSPYGSSGGAAYLVSGTGLAGADAADGETDRTIHLGFVAAQAGSWKILGENRSERTGVGVAAVPDIDGDGVHELLIGAQGHDPADNTDAGAAFLLSSGNLQAADLADGEENGVIELGNAASQSDSWKLVGETAGDLAGRRVASVGDIDGDGHLDIVVTAPNRTADGGEYRGVAYVISVADLASADSDDGHSDHVIDLANIAAQVNSWKLTNGNYLAWSDLSISTAPKAGSSTNWLLLGNHLITPEYLASADAQDGAADGIVDLRRLLQQPDSWSLNVAHRSVFVGDVDGDGNDDVLAGEKTGFVFSPAVLSRADLTLRSPDSRIDSKELEKLPEPRQLSGIALVGAAGAGDVDGDGLADMLIGNDNRSIDAERRGYIHVLQTADLNIIDRADGVQDGRTNLSNFVGDTDGDGISDLLDRDDDNDSYPDAVDSFQHDPAEWADSDLDGVGDNADAFPANRREWLDTDGDGLGDFYEDDDDDGDGIADVDDQYPLDTDNDAIENDIDSDDDGDGTPDVDDQLPLDASDTLDTDGDGIGNLTDTDDDGDGVLDADDAFPLEPGESSDSDGDGVGDNADAFVADANEHRDTDGDGIGDNADTDDDGDGVLDADDEFPLDASASMDTDGDGVPDSLDRYPTHPGEWANSDNAGFGDNRDTDDDNDGVDDVDDLFPYDRTRADLTSARIDLQTESIYLLPGVGAAGDIDGDGKQEMLVSGPDAESNGYVYIVSPQDLDGADKADGVHDGSIQQRNVPRQPGSWKLLGERSHAPGRLLVSLGDLDGDGRAEFLVSGGEALSSLSYLISGDDLLAADANDSSADGVVELGHIASQPGSWEMVAFWRARIPRIPLVGDLDNDGSVDLAVGQFGIRSGDSPGTVHVISTNSLPALDALSGSANGTISLASLGDGELWRLVGEAARSGAGASLAMTDFDADGLPDLIVGAPGYDAKQADEGAVYLLSNVDLAAADLADDNEDKQINLAHVAGEPNSWKIVGDFVSSALGAEMMTGDMDGDGQTDLALISYLPENSTAVTILSGAAGNLAALDAIDGTVDGTITLSNVTSGVNRRLSGPAIPNFRSQALLDFDGDGMDDLLLGITGGFRTKSKVAHLIRTSSILSGTNAFAQDNLTLDEQFSASGSYQIHAPEALVTNSHTAVASAGDIDADGRDDIYLAVFPFSSSAPPRPPSAAYVIMAADLPHLDAADGREDHKIFLSNLVRARRD